MASDTVKLVLYNSLAESAAWDVDAGGLTKPPAVSLTAGAIDNYTNIAAGADHLALLSDGDQNLPIIATGATLKFEWDFGVAFKPEIIAAINHNCFETGDFIRITSGPASPPANVRRTIQAPDRSADLFYPFRFNDCFYNNFAIDDRFWAVEFSKNSGSPYIGEIFFGSEYFSYQEWDPQPRPPLPLAYQRNASRNEIVSGSEIIYDIRPPYVNIGLDWGRKAEGPTDSFLEHQVDTVMTAASHSPYKQVLVLRDDRICVFGRFEPSGGYQALTDDSIAPSYQFRAEYPRKFWRSGLVA